MSALRIALFASLAAAGAAYAHHSPAAYDQTTEVFLDGTVAEIAWKNPHVYVTLDTTAADGAVVQQEIEVGPVASLVPLGLTQAVLEPGEHVVVRANPSRRGAGRTVLGLDVTTDDGAVYPLHLRGRRSAPELAARTDTLAGQWSPAPEDFLALYRAIETWPLKDEARAGLTDIESLRASEASCESYPAPMLTLLPPLRTIAVSDDEIGISFDWMGVERVVHLDRMEHPADLESTVHGHSIGWWEGDSLVIDSVGFTPHRQGLGQRVPSTEAKHMVERLTLAEDGRSLRYAFTLEDPGSLTEPVSFASTWNYRPDVEPSGIACDSEIATRMLAD